MPSILSRIKAKTKPYERDMYVACKMLKKSGYELELDGNEVYATRKDNEVQVRASLDKQEDGYAVYTNCNGQWLISVTCYNEKSLLIRI